MANCSDEGVTQANMGYQLFCQIVSQANAKENSWKKPKVLTKWTNKVLFNKKKWNDYIADEKESFSG